MLITSILVSLLIVFSLILIASACFIVICKLHWIKSSSIVDNLCKGTVVLMILLFNVSCVLHNGIETLFIVLNSDI